MQQFVQYDYAIVSIAIWLLMVQLLGAAVGAAKARSGLVPGATPPADYASRLYRMHRAYQNSVDNLAMLVAAIVIAILAGAPVFWVNLFASVAVVARLVMVFIHIMGLGNAAFGLRTMTYVFHWALILAIAAMAVVAVL